jgi:very-short-patch-repair endonuclease
MRDKVAQERARQMRLGSTDTEKHLWRFLRRRHVAGARFRRQYPVGPFIADFVCLDAMLVVELDGGQHQTAIAYDAHRDRFLKAQGFRVLRFWNNEVLQQTDAVLQVIWEAVAAAKKPPPP